MRARRDPGARLVAAIVADGVAAGCAPRLVTLDEQEWASATFVGVRQRLVLAAPATPARAAWLAALPDTDWLIPGHVVADLAIAPVGGDANAVAIETLLLAAT